MKALICIAGLDGSGKSTQVELLSHWLQKNNQESVVYSFFKSELKDKYRETINYVRKKKLQLNRDQFLVVLASFQIKFNIKKIVSDPDNTNKIIILDRYLETIYAHAKLQEIDKRMIDDIFDDLYILPNWYFFINVPHQKCYQRICERNKDFALHETLESMEILEQSYDEMIRKFNMIVIDGNQNIQEVHKEIVKRFTSICQ